VAVCAAGRWPWDDEVVIAESIASEVVRVPISPIRGLCANQSTRLPDFCAAETVFACPALAGSGVCGLLPSGFVSNSLKRSALLVAPVLVLSSPTGEPSL
jgi:hypothetical protein